MTAHMMKIFHYKGLLLGAKGSHGRQWRAGAAARLLAVCAAYSLGVGDALVHASFPGATGLQLRSSGILKAGAAVAAVIAAPADASWWPKPPLDSSYAALEDQSSKSQWQFYDMDTSESNRRKVENACDKIAFLTKDDARLARIYGPECGTATTRVGTGERRAMDDLSDMCVCAPHTQSADPCKYGPSTVTCRKDGKVVRTVTCRKDGDVVTCKKDGEE